MKNLIYILEEYNVHPDFLRNYTIRNKLKDIIPLINNKEQFILNIFNIETCENICWFNNTHYKLLTTTTSDGDDTENAYQLIRELMCVEQQVPYEFIFGERK